MNIQNTTGKSDPEIPEFIIKDSLTVQGISDDFVWYESEILLRDMGAWESRFKHLVSVMEARRKEHMQMIDGLLHEVKVLKQQLKEKE